MTDYERAHPCRCLCVANHPDEKGVCEGHSRSWQLVNLSSGYPPVLMCLACARATRERRDARETKGA